MVERVVETEEAGARQDAEGEERKHPEASRGCQFSLKDAPIKESTPEQVVSIPEIEPKVVWFSATSYYAALL